MLYTEAVVGAIVSISQTIAKEFPLHELLNWSLYSKKHKYFYGSLQYLLRYPWEIIKHNRTMDIHTYILVRSIPTDVFLSVKLSDLELWQPNV